MFTTWGESVSARFLTQLALNLLVSPTFICYLWISEPSIISLPRRRFIWMGMAAWNSSTWFHSCDLYVRGSRYEATPSLLSLLLYIDTVWDLILRCNYSSMPQLQRRLKSQSKSKHVWCLQKIRRWTQNIYVYPCMYMLHTCHSVICPIPSLFHCERRKIGVCRFSKLSNSWITLQGPIPIRS